MTVLARRTNAVAPRYAGDLELARVWTAPIAPSVPREAGVKAGPKIAGAALLTRKTSHGEIPGHIASAEQQRDDHPGPGSHASFPESAF